MENKTKGAWLIHHTNKLQSCTTQMGYNNTFMAGKAGILLSSISANDENTINVDQLHVLANSANINTSFELPVLINLLKDRFLIDKASDGSISVLGVTTSSSLMHTCNIFEGLKPSALENASIDLAEKASISPILFTDVSEELSDIHKLSKEDTKRLLNDSEQFGFVDTELISKNEKLLFNGNLFRRETSVKIKKVLDSLTSEEQKKLSEFNEILSKNACVVIELAKKILGESLFIKVTSIGFYDINVVSNSNEEAGFITLPSAFSKYSNSMVDDAFDLAKAFISSITYGMTKSPHERGQIRMVEALLNALVRGEKVGPVNAIAEDYKLLEFKGVVKVTYGQKKGRSGPLLELLKKEVGELALQAIRQGDVSEHSLKGLPTAAVTKFNGPEINRENMRKKQISFDPSVTNDMLSSLRTGR